MAHILVVDDDPDIRDVMSRTLERAGHDVAVASDGSEAAAMHVRREFDLIVSDLLMPGMNGIELTQLIRADPRCDIPILLVTASATTSDLEDAEAAGVTAHMPKPFKLAELRDQVAALLAQA